MAPQHNPDVKKGKKMKKVDRPKTDGRSAPQSVVEIMEASYEAADNAMKHLEHCRECGEGPICEASVSLLGEFQHKKNKALKAIREVPSAKRPGARRAEGSK